MCLAFFMSGFVSEMATIISDQDFKVLSFQILDGPTTQRGDRKIFLISFLKTNVMFTFSQPC